LSKAKPISHFANLNDAHHPRLLLDFDSDALADRQFIFLRFVRNKLSKTTGKSLDIERFPNWSYP